MIWPLPFEPLCILAKINSNSAALFFGYYAFGRNLRLGVWRIMQC
jgi:hypothetical protein